MNEKAPSPAAVKLKNAKSAYARLVRAARDPNLDWFSKSLDHMLANPPSRTCSLHNWNEQIAGYLLWQKPEGRYAKIKQLLDVGPGITSGSCLIERALRVDAFDCARLFHEHGASLDTLDGTVQDDIAKALGKGFWPHLEIIAPDFFATTETYEIARKSADYALAQDFYDDGYGFFSVNQTKNLIGQSNKHPDEIRNFYIYCLSRTRGHIAHAAAPEFIAEGMALLVQEKILDWGDFETNQRTIRAIDLAKATLMSMELNMTSPSACVAPRPNRGRL